MIGKICPCARMLNSFNLSFITKGTSSKTVLWNTVVENITHWKNTILLTTRNSLKHHNWILITSQTISKRTINQVGIDVKEKNKNGASEMISSQSVSTVHLSNLFSFTVEIKS